MIGQGMLWSEALVYLRAGWAVRREPWKELLGTTEDDTALRWIVFHNHLFYVLYSDAGTVSTAVVRSPEFGPDEFHAGDWTVHPPDCYVSSAGVVGGGTPYPGEQDEPPLGLDPVNPNIRFGPCVSEPPVDPVVDPVEGDGDPPPVQLPDAPPVQLPGWGPNPPLPGPPPGAPQFGGGGAGGGGGGGGGGNKGQAKPKKPRPVPPSCTLVANRTTPAGGCHWSWNAATGLAPETFSGTFTLGASADARLQAGLWWATITIASAGQFFKETYLVSLEDVTAWGPLVAQVVPCHGRIIVTCVLHHPPTGTQCSDRAVFTAYGMCGSEVCPVPPP